MKSKLYGTLFIQYSIVNDYCSKRSQVQLGQKLTITFSCDSTPTNMIHYCSLPVFKDLHPLLFASLFNCFTNCWSDMKKCHYVITCLQYTFLAFSLLNQREKKYLDEWTHYNFHIYIKNETKIIKDVCIGCCSYFMNMCDI